MILSLLKPNQDLIYIYYFTSRISNNPDKEKRQKIYLEALETLQDFKIIYGKFQSNIETCRKCGNTYPYASEKMTDVNIAITLLEDAFLDKYDTAFLITGDSDLVPPIKSIHKLFPIKRVFVAFPPNRENISIKNEAKGSMTIGRKKLKDGQFPQIVVKSNGYKLEKPISWQ